MCAGVAKAAKGKPVTPQIVDKVARCLVTIDF